MKGDFFSRLSEFLIPIEEEPLEEVSELRLASVLVPLTRIDGEINLLLSKRTELVPHHKGQICFPGGTREADDRSLLHTAMRESEEELGIKEGDVTILGRLQSAPTMTKFLITPYVGEIGYPYEFKPDSFEVDEVFYAPLKVFLDLARYRRTVTLQRGSVYPLFFFDYGNRTVWGATAKIIREFAELIIDKELPL